VLPALGDRPVREIDAATVEQAVRAWAGEDVSRSTVRGARGALARVLDEAVTDGLLTRNPARDTADHPAVAAAGPEPPQMTSAVDAARSFGDADPSARDDQDEVGQIDPPEQPGVITHDSLPDQVTEPGPAASRRDDTAEVGDDELDPLDEKKEIPDKDVATESRPVLGPIPDRPPAAVGADDAADRDPVAGARWAVARVGQLRAAAERELHSEERARAEQLTRWHADDQAAEADDRNVDEVAR